MSIQESITQKLTEQLAPLHLEVLNESNRHSVPAGSETHFKLWVVSPQFEGQNRVARHRLVHDLLATELKQGVHALSMTLQSPEEWQAPMGSPPCMGGSKKEGR